MKKLFLGVASLLLTQSAFANPANGHAQPGQAHPHLSSYRKGGNTLQAVVSLNSAANSPGIPLVNDQPIVLNSLSTSSNKNFQFDSTTGTLTLSSNGNYTIGYSFNLQNTGASTSVGGVYVTQNSTIIPNSSFFHSVGAGQTALFNNTFNFSGKAGAQIKHRFFLSRNIPNTRWTCESKLYRTYYPDKLVA